MAEVKVTLTGEELTELRLLLMKQAGKLTDDQLKLALQMSGYEPKHSTLEMILASIAEKLLAKLR